MAELNWLDKNYVQTVLRNSEKDESIRVSSIMVKPAVAKGDNFMSDMVRVTAEFSRNYDRRETIETKSIIAKITPVQGTAHAEMISKGRLFEKEISMMSHSLPMMNQILAQLNVTSLSARCLHVQFDTPIHLIIEDLTPKGYRIFQRGNHSAGLDLDHSLLAIRNLAAFHASSVTLVEKDSDSLDKYTSLFHEDQGGWFVNVINSGVKALGLEAVNWTELNPRISEKILKLSKVFFSKLCQNVIARKTEFNVLNHGDFWTNNIMFRYDGEGKPIDLKFVDFQASFYGSPALDLLFFLGSSIRDDVIVEKREFLLREYHTSLTSAMAKLKCKTEAPSFEDFERILQDHMFHELAATFIMLPNIAPDKEARKSVDELARVDGSLYQNKSYRKVMTRLLPMYDSIGLLDS